MANLILWLFILILGLSFFGISIEAIIESPAGQANFGYLLHLLSNLWDTVSTFINHFIGR